MPRPAPVPDPRPTDRFGALAQLAEAAGAESLAGEARRLSQRLQEGLFHVACLGQFKRGKSTLLNALVGEDVLPVGVVPVTSVVTILRFGEPRRGLVHSQDGRARPIDVDEVAAFVSEEGNPDNRKGIAAVELFLPSPLLGRGMCLVDTPGVGSVFSRATEATRAFVPHVDAALVVLGADPPITADELALVTEVAAHVEQLIFVLSKVDRLNERERAEAAAFSQRVLAERLGRPIGPLLEVSGLAQRSGRAVGDWPALVERLTKLAAEAGADLVHRSGERWFHLLAARLKRDLAEQRAALERPLEETAGRIAELRSTLGTIDQTLGDLGHLFSAEQERLADQLVCERETFVADALPGARAELREWLGARRSRGGALWKGAAKEAQRIAGVRLARWFTAQQPIAEERYRAAARRFADLANEELARLARVGLAGAEQLPPELAAELGFRSRSRLFYTELWELAARSPAVWLATTLGTEARARSAVQKTMDGYLAELLSMNATRVQNDFDERILESRRRLEAEIRTLLTSASSSAERALARAQAAHRAGTGVVQEAIDRTALLELELAELAGGAGTGPGPATAD
ncbi:MAG TPA: dynamin family protein [Myxococcales bacterium]|nr:dynamin family protein [Myxococcales bacterium]